MGAAALTSFTVIHDDGILYHAVLSESFTKDIGISAPREVPDI